MADTEITQKRKAVIIDGSTKYEINTIVKEKGDLDDDGIFLVEILDADDPKEDALIRVITPADIDTYNLDRDAAIAAGDVYWRAAEFIRRYDSLDVAIAAAAVIKSRVSTFVTEWAKYVAEFFTTGEDTIVPLVDGTLLAEKINEYITLNDALTEAQTEAESANTDFTDAEADLAATNATAESLDVAVDAISELSDSIDDLKSGITVLENLVAAIGDVPSNGFGVSPAGGTRFYLALDTLLVAIRENGDDIDDELLVNPNSTIQTAIDAIQIAELTFTNALSANLVNAANAAGGAILDAALAARNITVNVDTVESNAALAITAKTAAQVALNTAKTAALTKAAELEVAKKAVDAALAAVIDLCPDFDVSDPTEKLDS